MASSIKTDEADRLARQVAGESRPGAVTKAVRERFG